MVERIPSIPPIDWEREKELGRVMVCRKLTLFSVVVIGVLLIAYSATTTFADIDFSATPVSALISLFAMLYNGSRPDTNYSGALLYTMLAHIVFLGGAIAFCPCLFFVFIPLAAGYWVGIFLGALTGWALHKWLYQVLGIDS